MKEKIAFYADRLHHIRTNIHSFHNKINLFSWLRLLVFAIGTAFVVGFSNTGYYAYLAAAFIMLVVLVSVILYHQKLYKKRSYLLLLAEVNQNEIEVLSGGNSIFSDGLQHAARLPFADDLDLFGKHSLFAYLNRATTRLGNHLLAENLIHTPTEALYIKEFQQATQQMAQVVDFNQDIMVRLLMAYRKIDFLPYEPPASLPVYLFTNLLIKLSRFLLPILVSISFLFFIVSGNIGFFILSGGVAILFVFSQSRKMNLLSSELSGYRHSLKVYNEVLVLFAAQKWQGAVLTEMQKVANEASESMLKLSKLSELFDRRNNLILYVAGNVFMLYDIQIAVAYENWKKQNNAKIARWIENVGRLEMLMSLGTYSFNHPEYIYPQLINHDALIASGLGHVLIPEERCVVNNVQLKIDPRLVLITGSNMSGKSTWLRTLGTNVLLAQIGAPVYAQSFQWKPMKVLSSLRQSDSLSENTSLFMNELMQLKAILDQASTGKLCLILLDEVLRGTNSDDKYAGSKALIKRLIECSSLTVIASHDLKLSEIENEPHKKVVNYCFESTIENGQLLFDYKIRKGVAVNRNATWLMREMGIIGSS